MSVTMSAAEFERLLDLLPQRQQLKIVLNGGEIGEHEVIFRPRRDETTGRVTFAWGVNVGGENVIVGDGSSLTMVYGVDVSFSLKEG